MYLVCSGWAVLLVADAARDVDSMPLFGLSGRFLVLLVLCTGMRLDDEE